MIKKGTSFEVEDGRKDAFILVDGERFLTLHQEGYEKLGMTYASAILFVAAVVELIEGTSDTKSPEEPSEDAEKT